MSNIIGYKLLNAMCIDYKYCKYPFINIEFDTLDIEINDTLFINDFVLICVYFKYILYKFSSNIQMQNSNNNLFIFNNEYCQYIPITMSSPIIINTNFNIIEFKIKLKNPFDSHLNDINKYLLHIICTNMNNKILISSNTMYGNQNPLCLYSNG